MIRDPMPALLRNQAMLRRSRFLELRFGVGVGDELYAISISADAVRVDSAGSRDGMAFTIEASPQAWTEYARDLPAPGFNDVVAMAESGNGEIRGDDLLPFFANSLLVKGVVAAMFRGDASW